MKIQKEIFQLAIPNILSNISVPLIASVDTGLMGHLSANHLAAVGSSSMIFNFLYWNFGFLRMGTTGLIAQAYGKKDEKAKSKSFLQAALVALVIAFLLLILQGLLGSFSFQLMNLDSNLQELASEYFYIRIWDAPATLLLYVVMAWFFGNQNAFIPLVITIVINVTNIGMSLLFVRYYDWGIAGVAWGSVIANYVGVSLAVILILLKYKLVQVKLLELNEGLSRFFHLNKDIFLRTLMLSITFAFLYSQAATFGAITLGAMVIILQFTNWMSYAVDGFAYASEAMVGKYIGAEQNEEANSTIKLSFLYGGILAIIFSIIYGIFPKQIASLFTDKPEVINTILDVRIWIIVFPIVGFASYIWDGVFIGLTASKAMRNTMLVSFISFLGTYYVCKYYELGFTSLLIALTVYLVSRGIAQTYVYYKHGNALE